MSLGPLDLTGGPFLELYLVLLAAAVVAGILIPRLLRPEGRPNDIVDPDQIAYLAGGVPRFQEAVTARLLAARALALIDRKSFRAIDRDKAASPAEKDVLRLASPIHWREIRLALKPHVRPLVQRLTGAGLLVDAQEGARIRFLAISPYLLLFAFGAAKWILGAARDRPVGYLTLLLMLTVAFAILRWLSIDRRTRAAHEEIEAARHRSSRLAMAPTSPEISMAVALFGTEVLAGSGWADFHKLRNPGQAGSACGSGCWAGGGGWGGGGGGDGGSGGGGCGGGGCGGCGG